MPRKLPVCGQDVADTLLWMAYKAAVPCPQGRVLAFEVLPRFAASYGPKPYVEAIGLLKEHFSCGREVRLPVGCCASGV
jgi:hypothetical protein